MKFILLILLCPFCVGAYQYNLAICTIFKDESPYLKEWIEYHRLIGFDHFYLYNNDSTDDFQTILAPYIAEGVVEVFTWGDSNHSPWHTGGDFYYCGYQLSAYNDCMERARGTAELVAVFDIDEYLVPVQGKQSFEALLNSFRNNASLGSMGFYWRIFGTSDVWTIPEGALLIDTLTWRAGDQHRQRLVPKLIHKPEAVVYCRIVSDQTLKPGFQTAYADPQQFRINHYKMRGMKELFHKRYKVFISGLDEMDYYPEYYKMAQEYHYQQDLAIKQYSVPLKQAMTP